MSTNLCDKIGSNTGAIKCDTRRGRPVSMSYGGKVFQAAEYGTPEAFKAAFKAAINLPNGNGDKLFPIQENVGMNDQTSAPKTSTLGSYGPEVILVDGRSAYEFDLAIGITLEKKLRQLNGEIAPFFIWDDKKNMWGADDGAGGFIGVDCIVSVIPKPFEDGKDARVTRFKISVVNEAQFADDAAYVPAKNMKGSDFKGLNDVHVRYMSGDETKMRVAVEIPTSIMGVSLNIFDEFKTSALGVGIAAWVAWSVSPAGVETPLEIDSVAVTEAAVAPAAAGKGFILTFDAVAAAAIVAGSTVYVDLVDTTALQALLVKGIESVTPAEYVTE